MLVADARCARCARAVGWHFVECLRKGPCGRRHNAHHEGRHGLVKSAFVCERPEDHAAVWAAPGAGEDDHDEEDEEEGEANQDEDDDADEEQALEDLLAVDDDLLYGEEAREAFRQYMAELHGISI